MANAAAQEHEELWNAVRAKAAADSGSVPVKARGAREWGVVRVFVSSTFTDMHAEREMLVRDVFPRLRLECAKRKLHLMYTDLRWGVPKDTAAPETIRTCLSEIDRCKSENGLPLFLWLGGERYGWVPDQSQVPPEAHARWDWVDGFSITAMEVCEAAVRCNNGRALFALRDAGFLESEAFRGLGARTGASFMDVVWEGNEPTWVRDESMKAKQDALKHTVRGLFAQHDQVLSYSVRVSGVDQFGKPTLSGLEQLGQWVQAKLEATIAQAFPIDEELAEMTLRERHDEFLHTLAASGLVAHGRQVDEIVGCVENGKGRVCCVVGEPGAGKTALLCNVLAAIEDTGEYHVVLHLAAVGSHSTEPLAVALSLRAQFKALLRSLSDQGASPSSPQEPDTPSSVFHDVCAELHSLMNEVHERVASSPGKQSRVLVVLDSVELVAKLEPTPGDTNMLLPLHVPETFTVLLAADEATAGSLVARRDSVVTVGVATMPPEACEQLVAANLGRWNKKLHPDQMQALLAKSHNPLWLSLACSELTRFGVFEKVSELVDSLPPTLSGLHTVVLERLEERSGVDVVRKALSLLALSRSGLLEVELVAIVWGNQQGEGEGKGEGGGGAGAVSGPGTLAWARLFEDLSVFLRDPGSKGERQLSFAHEATRAAVLERYCPTPAAQRDLRIALAFHVVGKQGAAGHDDDGGGGEKGETGEAGEAGQESEGELLPTHRVAFEAPFQLVKAGAHKALRVVLGRDDVLTYLALNHQHELVSMWGAMENGFEKAAETYRANVERACARDDSKIGFTLVRYCNNAANALEVMGQPHAAVEIHHAGMRATQRLQGIVDAKASAGELDAQQAAHARLELAWSRFRSANNLGRLHTELGALDEGERWVREALAVLDGPLAKEPEAVVRRAETEEALAACLGAQGKLDDAHELLRGVLAVYRDQSPLKVAGVLVNVGLVHRRRGELDEAQRVYEEALGIVLASRNHLNLDAATLYMNLGVVLMTKGELAAAKQTLEKGLAVCEELYGANHRRTAQFLDNLAIVALQSDPPELDAAVAHASKAVGILERALGRTNALLLVGLTTLGKAYERLGDAAKAGEYLEWLAEGQEANNEDASHTRLRAALQRLNAAKQGAIQHATEGRLEEAKPLFDRVVELTQAHFANHPQALADAMFNAGLVRAQLGDPAGAVERVEGALAVMRDNGIPEDNPMFQRYAGALGDFAAMMAE